MIKVIILINVALFNYVYAELEESVDGNIEWVKSFMLNEHNFASIDYIAAYRIEVDYSGKVNGIMDPDEGNFTRSKSHVESTTNKGNYFQCSLEIKKPEIIANSKLIRIENDGSKIFEVSYYIKAPFIWSFEKDAEYKVESLEFYGIDFSSITKLQSLNIETSYKSTADTFLRGNLNKPIISNVRVAKPIGPKKVR